MFTSMPRRGLPVGLFAALLLTLVPVLTAALAAADTVRVVYTWEGDPATAPAADPAKPPKIAVTLPGIAGDPKEFRCFAMVTGRQIVAILPTAKLSETARKLHLFVEATADFPYTVETDLDLSTKNLDTVEKPIPLKLTQVDPVAEHARRMKAEHRHTIRVEVTRPHEDPLVDAYVTLDRLTDKEAEAGGKSDEKGVVTLEGVREGDYVLRVHTNGRLGLGALLKPVTIKDETPLKAALEYGVTVTGKIGGINRKNGTSEVSFIDTQYGLYCGRATLNRDLEYKISLAPGTYKVKFTQDAFHEYIVGDYEVKAAEAGPAHTELTHDITIPPKTLKPLLENDPNIVE